MIQGFFCFYLFTFLPFYPFTFFHIYPFTFFLFYLFTFILLSSYISHTKKTRNYLRKCGIFPNFAKNK